MIIEGYITGLDRNEPDKVVAHLYKGTFDNPGLPMCARGWNRSDGERYSIFRENVGAKGVCAVCIRRAQKGLDGVPSRPRKTKYI